MRRLHAFGATGWVILTALVLMFMPVIAQATELQAGYRMTDYAAGVQAYRAGDFERAISYFRRTLSQDNANTNAHYYLALSLDGLSLAEEAAPEYRYVVSHGSERRIVDYARQRLSIIQPQAIASSASSSDVALVAAGSQIVPTVYRGMAAKVAVPIKGNRNALMVDATLSNADEKATGTFIIDTGATYTSISREMAQELGLDTLHCETVRITTANGRIEVPKVIIKRLNVNGLEAHDVEATVIDVRPGSSFQGLLGLSFIRQFVLTIDPQAGHLIFQKN